MRYYEFMREKVNPVDVAKSDIMDFIISLKSQGIYSATINQLIDYLKSDIDLSGTQLDQSFIENVIDQIDGANLQTNSSGILCLILDKDNSAPVDKEKTSQNTVDKMAQKVSVDSLKG